MKPFRKAARGSTVVEATLILMLLLGILFTIFDFGYALFLHHSLLHAARSAVRYGVVRPYDEEKIRNVALYGRETGSGSGIFGLQPSNVVVSREAGSPSDATKDRVVVTIQGYQYASLTWFAVGKRTGAPIRVSLTTEEK